MRSAFLFLAAALVLGCQNATDLGPTIVTEQGKDEPQFQAVSRADPDLAAAYSLASDTMQDFRDYVLRAGDHDGWAKLRFRDPDFSEEMGEDQFLYLWLADVRLPSGHRPSLSA